MLVFGTRPEAIKMCPLVNELKSRSAFRTIVCVTGQHRRMLDQVLDIFDVTPDCDLSIMKDRQNLFDITQSVLLRMPDIITAAAPDIVLVHGDTSTAFATSLACFYMQVKVGHVEAGLRTNNIYLPYPEEYNRQAIDLVSRFSFAPTQWAKDNLLRENKDPETIFVTGNTIVDALKTTVRDDFDNAVLRWAGNHRLITFTMHRRESIGEPMRSAFRAVKKIVSDFPDCRVVYPIHLNPVIRTIAEEIFDGDKSILLTDPMDVLEFHNILARSWLVLTDSGGIQEEAASLGKPTLVLRDVTERPEGVEAGILKLVGTDEDKIYEEFKKLTDPGEYQQMCRASSVFGSGDACKKIADILQQA